MGSGLGAVVGVELVKDGSQVRFDGVFRDVEGFTDLVVAQSAGHEGGDFLLARGEEGSVVAGGRRGTGESLGGDVDAAGEDELEGLAKDGVRGGFRDKAGGSELEGLVYGFYFFCRGEDDDLGLCGGSETREGAEAVSVREFEVEQDQSGVRVFLGVLE